MLIEDNTLIKMGFTYLIAVMSPGPSILVILGNSVFYNKLIGIWTAVGTMAGIALQSIYVLLGIKFIHSYPLVLMNLQIICGCYLIYIGINGLIKILYYKKVAEFKNINNNCITIKQAFKQGFLIDALNPLALTFFLTIFSIFIPHNTPFTFKVICWLEIILLGGCWFIGVSLLLTHNSIKSFLNGSIGKIINLTSLIIFLFLGGKLCLLAII